VGLSEDEVSQSFAAGAVTTGKDGIAGGLIGRDTPDIHLKGYKGSVLNSYATGVSVVARRRRWADWSATSTTVS
jgi:hypothetical protein